MKVPTLAEHQAKSIKVAQDQDAANSKAIRDAVVKANLIHKHDGVKEAFLAFQGLLPMNLQEFVGKHSQYDKPHTDDKVNKIRAMRTSRVRYQFGGDCELFRRNKEIKALLDTDPAIKNAHDKYLMLVGLMDSYEELK